MKRISRNAGQVSKNVYRKRKWLVDTGRASWFELYLPLEELEKRLTL